MVDNRNWLRGAADLGMNFGDIIVFTCFSWRLNKMPTKTFSNAMMLRIRFLSLYSFGRVAVTVTPQLRNVRHD